MQFIPKKFANIGGEGEHNLLREDNNFDVPFPFCKLLIAYIYSSLRLSRVYISGWMRNRLLNSMNAVHGKLICKCGRFNFVATFVAMWQHLTLCAVAGRQK